MSVHLQECLSLSEGGRAVRVDRERGIIHGCKILGWQSANGRRYEPDGVEARLYEGRRVNAGHVRVAGDRDPRDTYAVLEGVTKSADGLYADRLQLLNPKGEFEQRILGAAEKAPHLFGLSHTARGREKAGSGGRIIEAVESVESVDLVSDPATVSGFFESRNPTVKLKDLIESLKAKRPRYAKALQEAVDSGVMSPDAPMDAPPDAPPADGDHESAILDAAAAVLRDDSLSVADKLKKIRTLLMMTGGKSDSGGEPGGDEPATESRRLRDENARLLAEKLVRKEAAKANVPLSETLCEALARPGMTEQQAQAVVNELKGAGAGGQRVRSAGPVSPPAGGNKGGSGGVQESKTEIPAGAKDRAAWLRRA